MPITPYTGPFGPAQLRHLLRRSLFGCTPADFLHFNGMSLQQVVNELLTFTTTPDPPIKAYTAPDGNNNPDPYAVDPDVTFGSTWVNSVRDPNAPVDASEYRVPSFMFWRTGLMINQERNLREKLTLFWFNHMPVQAFTVFDGELLYQYDQKLRQRCKGNFRLLIEDITKEGAMLYFLNGYLNSAGSPDENYARELLELFTLGVGTGYTQDDVQQAARVLTGWTVQNYIGGQPSLATTVFEPSLHDPGDKQFSAFFNNTVITGSAGPNAGNVELDAMLNMIFAKDEVSFFIVRELYRWFVHGTIDAVTEADVITPLAQLFRDNVASPNQIRIIVEALLTSEHFFSPEVRNCMVKSPADVTIGLLRMFGMPFPDPATQFEALYRMWGDAYWATEYCGQSLCIPPNVAGWPAYYQYPQFDDIWMDTAMLANRNGVGGWWTYGSLSTDNTLYQTQSQNLDMRVDFVALVQQFSDPADPNALIDDACKMLFGPPISQSVKDQLKVNILLQGQLVDLYWSDAYTTYVADPNTTDPSAQMVPDILRWLFGELLGAAEFHLY